MGSAVWFDEPPPVDLAGRRGGSHLCLGPPSTSDIEVAGNLRQAPQAFLAEFRPGFRLDVHFHRVDQFQWFVRGEGTFASHPIGVNTLHFADRLTPYGPLVTGATGTAFLTLRSVADSGAHFMPASRGELRERLRAAGVADPSARRNLTWDLASVDFDRGRWTDLRAEPDGLRVSAVRLGLGDPLPEVAASGTGAYLAVLNGHIAGAATAEGTVCRVRACGFSWLDPGDSSPSVVAGVDDTLVGLFQLPSAPWLTAETVDG